MKAKKIFHFSVGPIGAALLGFITLPFIAWFFSVEDVGRLSMLQVMLTLSITVFSLGMHQAYVREYHEVENKATLLKSAVLPGLIVLFLFSLLSFLSMRSISKLLFGFESISITLLLLMAVWVTFIINFLSHVLRMQERGLAFSATQVMPRAMLLALVSFIVFLNFKKDFQILMIINTIAVSSSAFLFIWLTRSSWLLALNISTDYQLMKKMLLFSLPLVIGGLAHWGLTAMDRFFLRAMSGFDELGVYSMAASLAAGASVLTIVFSNLWHPIVYRWEKEGIETERVVAVIENVFIVLAFTWSIMGVFSWLILYVLPPEYNAVMYLIVACIAAPLFYLISEATVIGIGISRRSSFAMVASILAFVVNGLLNYLLIPSLGAGGAAIATVIAFFVFFVFRTEASCYLWHPFPRFKIYILSIFYILLTIVMVLQKSQIENLYVGWLLLLALTLMFFYKRVKTSFMYLRTR